MSVTLDDPTFPTTIYARLIEEEDGTHIVLAVQLFVTLIEFKLTTLAGLVLVPFALWNKTADGLAASDLSAVTLPGLPP